MPVWCLGRVSGEAGDGPGFSDSKAFTVPHASTLAGHAALC